MGDVRVSERVAASRRLAQAPHTPDGSRQESGARPDRQTARPESGRTDELSTAIYLTDIFIRRVVVRRDRIGCCQRRAPQHTALGQRLVLLASTAGLTPSAVDRNDACVSFTLHCARSPHLHPERLQRCEEQPRFLLSILAIFVPFLFVLRIPRRRVSYGPRRHRLRGHGTPRAADTQHPGPFHCTIQGPADVQGAPARRRVRCPRYRLCDCRISRGFRTYGPPR